jgi:hypothetical protein
LREIEALDGMPSRDTMRAWLRDKPDFSVQYAQAKEAFAEREFEKLHAIADNVDESHEAIAKARLRIDTRKWTLARLAPKKYGDKVQQEVSGPGGGPVEGNIKIEFVKPGDGTRNE